MKFCKDCRYMQLVPGLSVGFASCIHPKLINHNPVTGEISSWCRSERSEVSGNLCGKDGKLFEPFEIVTVGEALQ